MVIAKDLCDPTATAESAGDKDEEDDAVDKYLCLPDVGPVQSIQLGAVV